MSKVSPISHFTPKLTEIDGFHRVGQVDRGFCLLVHLDQSDQQLQLVSLGGVRIGVHQIVNTGQGPFVVFFRYNDLRDYYTSSALIASYSLCVPTYRISTMPFLQLIFATPAGTCCRRCVL